MTLNGGVGPAPLKMQKALMRLECIKRLLQETSADDTGARAVCARDLLAQMVEDLCIYCSFSLKFMEKLIKGHKSYRTNKQP